MDRAIPMNSKGNPTNAHQKYRGGSKVPNDEKKLATPMTVSTSPIPARQGPRIRSTVLVAECLGSMFGSPLMRVPRFRDFRAVADFLVMLMHRHPFNASM